jgi:hypothetical protein
MALDHHLQSLMKALLINKPNPVPNHPKHVAVSQSAADAYTAP